MLPKDHFFLEGKEIKSDTRAFLDRVLQALLNILARKNANTRDVELLGTNDVHVFRGTNIIVFAFSRSKYLLHPRFCEFAL